MNPIRLSNIRKVFDPTHFNLPLECHFYAQSPQTLVFDNCVRVYFSSRYIDSPGNFVSRIIYADFDTSFESLLRISNKPVLEPAGLGTYDEHGIFPLHVFREGSRIFGYICGLSRRQSVSVESSIGLSESFDEGETFVRKGIGPVITSSLFEPFLVCDPFVLKEESVYHMWYVFGLRWMQTNPAEKPERVYKIGHATSFDQINWKKENKSIISDVIDEDECQALPTVMSYKGIYHMIFCYRKAIGFRDDKSKGYRLGYAYSNDLLNWTRNDELLKFENTQDSWDADMRCYPHFCRINEKIFLLFNGNEFGKYGFGVAEIDL